MQLPENEKPVYDKSSEWKLESLQKKLKNLRIIFSSKNPSINKGKIAKEILLTKAKIKNQKQFLLKK